MFKWSKNYDAGKDNLKERIAVYQEKVINLKNSKNIYEFLERCMANRNKDNFTIQYSNK
ncbi:hypothetical protein RBU61_13600 [Tissierella sp. MB52-C2]|uniref:hypothetical protein n=1 Tax=Tissierella sp. MB52-C2 TaxID=3070999 RepID=UPI00280B040D|nr:hypothetical protein [Tissierella sp. MB52-C2]WMM23953.1 hypothetical protein RBU61_13600 [Tissierella sp. MB52-C2]